MGIKSIEQLKNSTDFKTSDYMTNPKKEEQAEEENYFLDMKAEDAEIKRASQQNNDIYRLQLKAHHGDCNAIKKLINYSFNNFNLDSSFANQLTKEANEMLEEARAIYTTSCGKLSDDSINAAKIQIENNNHGEKSDMEMAQEYNNLIADMELGCSRIY